MFIVTLSFVAFWNDQQFLVTEAIDYFGKKSGKDSFQPKGAKNFAYTIIQVNSRDSSRSTYFQP